jgi:hypothetical protein
MALEVEYKIFQDIGKIIIDHKALDIIIDFRQFGKKIIAIVSTNFECSFPKKQSEIMTIGNHYLDDKIITVLYVG